MPESADDFDPSTQRAAMAALQAAAPDLRAGLDARLDEIGRRGASALAELPFQTSVQMMVAATDAAHDLATRALDQVRAAFALEDDVDATLRTLDAALKPLGLTAACHPYLVVEGGGPDGAVAPGRCGVGFQVMDRARGDGAPCRLEFHFTGFADSPEAAWFLLRVRVGCLTGV